jgi:hypothetical protein
MSDYLTVIGTTALWAFTLAVALRHGWLLRGWQDKQKQEAERWITPGNRTTKL